MKKKKAKYNLKSKITSALRRVWYFSPMRNETIKRVKYTKTCELCGVVRDKLQCDHILPVVSEQGFNGWDEYITRLFVDSSGLRNICETCHKIFTDKSRAERKKNKK